MDVIIRPWKHEIIRCELWISAYVNAYTGCFDLKSMLAYYVDRFLKKISYYLYSSEHFFPLKPLGVGKFGQKSPIFQLTSNKFPLSGISRNLAEKNSPDGKLKKKKLNHQKTWCETIDREIETCEKIGRSDSGWNFSMTLKSSVCWYNFSDKYNYDRYHLKKKKKKLKDFKLSNI